MSWKPSRSSGVMFDKFARKSDRNRNEVVRMIEDNSYLHYDQLNRFSRHLYLYWLNENKKHCALVSRQFDPQQPFYAFVQCCIFDAIYNMLIKNKEHLYKPLQKLLS